ncbi:MAG: hypothetical protein KZQ95_11920 [Candidatus Thiodiazotropha sp. (ex Epidulcina cf. delphinae)]|nr:hypothetical protein [Candidatus Thiodiazotropha sp. (ex Epidulcina cf. delphinae)]
MQSTGIRPRIVKRSSEVVDVVRRFPEPLDQFAVRIVREHDVQVSARMPPRLAQTEVLPTPPLVLTTPYFFAIVSPAIQSVQIMQVMP